MKPRPEDERTASLAERFVPLVPAILLCLVAATQVWLTRTAGLSPWKGGGFGMFSTTDSEIRHFRIRVGDGDGVTDVSLPESVGESARVASAFPSRGRLESLGVRIAQVERAEGREVGRVEIQVLRLRYDEETMQPRFEVVREQVVDAR